MKLTPVNWWSKPCWTELWLTLQLVFHQAGFSIWSSFGVSWEKCEIDVWGAVEKRRCIRGNFLMVYNIFFLFSYSYSLSFSAGGKKVHHWNSSAIEARKWLKLLESVGVEWSQLQVLQSQWYVLCHVSHLQEKIHNPSYAQPNHQSSH